MKSPNYYYYYYYYYPHLTHSLLLVRPIKLSHHHHDPFVYGPQIFNDWKVKYLNSTSSISIIPLRINLQCSEPGRGSRLVHGSTTAGSCAKLSNFFARSSIQWQNVLLLFRPIHIVKWFRARFHKPQMKWELLAVRLELLLRCLFMLINLAVPIPRVGVIVVKQERQRQRSDTIKVG